MLGAGGIFCAERESDKLSSCPAGVCMGSLLGAKREQCAVQSWGIEVVPGSRAMRMRKTGPSAERPHCQPVDTEDSYTQKMEEPL